MPDKCLPLPSPEVIQRHVCQALRRYLPNGRFDPLLLPIPVKRPSQICGPLRLQAVTPPDWGAGYGVGGVLLVPVEACGDNDWWNVDWWLAAFLLLECWHERTWELNHGSVHSYSFRLEGWDTRAWDHAWVNRIGLFLRAWSAHSMEQSDDPFAPIPPTEILMTHDVDAVRKTLPIRIKQCAFNLINAARAAAKGEVKNTFRKCGVAMRFLFGREDWWTIDQLLTLENEARIKAHYNFYADTRKKTIKRWLFDPEYNIESLRIRDLLRRIKNQGCVIGLHPTFDAWEKGETIQSQCARLSRVSEMNITTCRQHWLRFSWQNTWTAQANAGLEHDTTLMFNDRSGFRASAALVWKPWDPTSEKCHAITQHPTVLMDSHLYDYQVMKNTEREASIRHWLHEVDTVNGEIAVLWHPHTLTKDYGWEQGFKSLVETIHEITACPHLQ